MIARILCFLFTHKWPETTRYTTDWGDITCKRCGRTMRETLQ